MRVTPHSYGLVLLALLLPLACTPPPPAAPSVVTSLPVAGLLVRPLLPDAIPVTVILPAGSSPHGFEPRPSDARALDQASTLVAIHPHVDGWMSRMTSRPVTYMEGEEHLHDDAHAWLDPVRVREGVPALVEALCADLPAFCVTIRERAVTWTAALDSLDAAIQRSMAAQPIRPLVTGQPFIQPLLDRYGVAYVGPVQDLPGQMVSAGSLSRLMDAISATGSRTLISQTILRDGGIARFAADTGLDVLLLDPVGNGYPSYEAYILDIVERLHAAR